MITDVELRWRGKTLEYRTQSRVRVTSGSYEIGTINSYDELRWSPWNAVPHVKARMRPTRREESRK